MRHWSQSQILLTATTIPVAVLVCWLVYKRATSSKPTTRKDSLSVRSVDENQVDDVMQVTPTSTSDIMHSENEQSDEEVVVAPSSLLDALEGTSACINDAELEFSKNNSRSLIEENLYTVNKPLKEVESTEINVGENSEATAQPLEDQHNKTSGDSVQPKKVANTLLEDLSEHVRDTNIESKLQASLQTGEENIDSSRTQDNSCSLSSHAYASETESAIQYDEAPTDMISQLSDSSLEKLEENLNVDIETKEHHTEILSKQDVNMDQNDIEKQDVTEESSSAVPAAIENHKDHLGNMDIASISDQQSIGSSSESIAVDSDINANNNNNLLEQKTTSFTNGEESFPKVITCSNGCVTNNELSQETSNVNHTEMNGWSKDVKTQEEKLSGDCKEERRSRKRPNSLPKLDILDNGMLETLQVYVEFPSWGKNVFVNFLSPNFLACSLVAVAGLIGRWKPPKVERVGLLIGKQGRNIKQLKQDSGADVFVHAAQYRDDIQVLQICGSQSEVESCVSRIKRRFNDISLSTFDPANISVPSPNSSLISPASTPPPMMYPVPNISQLRLPEGIPVEVTVSAIAAVDCVFLQQYTHPSYPGLEALEQAMSLCYAEPLTPCLPNPVQVGLICAAPQQGMWYRSQIIQCFEDSEEILIKFMDYGGYATMPGKSIKQIRADFVNLPFQAVECYLDNIAPPENNRFCEETVTKIADMLKDGRFQAKVTGYRIDGHAKIHLFKCLSDKVILINQEMATKGLATWVEPAPYQSS